MSTIPLSMHPMVVSFKKNLHTNPIVFERKKKLYYLVAVVSGIAAAAFLAASLFTFQAITAPFWVGLVGPIATQFIGCIFGTLTCKMTQNAQEVQRTANCLKELQNTYKAYQNIELSNISNTEKIIIPHCLLAKKEYLEAKNRLEELIQNTNSSNLESNTKEITILEHQMLISKIDLAFKTAILASVEDAPNCIIEEKDLLTISDQDPLIQNQIRGLNNNSLKHFSLPLVRFETNSSQSLYYNQVQEMSFDELKGHIFTVIQSTSLKP